MARFIAALFFVALSASISLAIPVTLNVSSSGQLMGAQNVQVGTNIYDVDFMDGTYADLFGQHGEMLTFRSRSTAISASQALLDQVLFDSSLGLFDSHPTLTNGIESTIYYGGVIYTPYTVPFLNSGGSYQFYAGAALNHSTDSRDHSSGWTTASSETSFDSTNNHWLTYAIWDKQPVTPVPEPSTFVLALIGIPAFVLYRKKVK